MERLRVVVFTVSTSKTVVVVASVIFVLELCVQS